MTRTMKEMMLKILTEYNIQTAFNPVRFYRKYSETNGQVLVVASHVYYTADLVGILKLGQVPPLLLFSRRCTQVIEKLITAGRRIFPCSSTFQSCLLLAMYFRDLSFQLVATCKSFNESRSMLKSSNQTMIESSDWINSFKVEYNQEDLTIFMSQSLYSTEYGYEYIGGAERLIWNKTQENCFRAMWVCNLLNFSRRLI